MTSDIIRAKYLGAPYLHKGRTIAGLDCYGLIIKVYEDLGIRLYDIDEDYTPDWSWSGRNYFIENYHKEWDKIELPEQFDVVLFCMHDNGIADHGGVMLNSDEFIHTCKAGTVVTKISQLRGKIEGYYRYKQNDNC